MLNADERYPKSWYPFCLGEEIKESNPLKVKAFGREWVAFKTEKGDYSVVSSYCRHMGTDLKNASIKGEHLVCPFHLWEYDTKGICKKMLNWDQEKPQSAKVTALPTLEFKGIVYVFFGLNPDYDFPFLDLSRDIVASTIKEEFIESPYQALIFNSIDANHLECIHDRKITSPLEFSSDHDYHWRATFRMEVVIKKLYDVIVNYFGGGKFDVILDCFGGNHLFISNPRTKDLILITSCPLDKKRSRIYLQALHYADQKNMIQKLFLKLRTNIVAKLGVSFLDPDFDIIQNMRPEHKTLLPGLDDGVKTFWQYYGKLSYDEELLSRRGFDIR
jgi:phenylpropionate dioxygenase-like ring-hydroxylating dioxygenase large terminal subunit